MTAASIVAAFRRIIVRLATIDDDDDATLAAQTLSRCLAGEDFDSAAGFAPGWRRSLQQAARDAALHALLTLHPELEAQSLARLIVAGVAARVRGVRPDGEDGYYHDLARADVDLEVRTWRRLIGEARGQTDHRLATQAIAVWSAAKPECKR